MFTGLSTLRAQEKKVTQEESAAKKQLNDYLKKYTDGGGEEQPKKKKRKVKKAAQPVGMQIVDEDLTGFKPVLSKEERLAATAVESEGEDGEGPTVANPEEADYYQRQLQQAKEFYCKRQDGSGWAALGKEEEGEGEEQEGQHGWRGRGRQAAANEQDASPPRRRQRHDSPDASPVRRQRLGSADASPPRRRQRHDSPPDASPPRRARHDSPDASPPRRRQRHDSPDASPPRRPAAAAAAAAAARAASPGSDVSPPRRRRHDSPDASPPRRPVQRDSADMSPPRRPAGAGAAAAAAGPGRAKPGGMADGTATGLVSAEQLAAEARRLRDENERRRLQAAGRNEETVYRDRETGRLTSKEEFAEARARARRKRPEPTPEEQHIEWKGGLAQKRAAEEAQRRMQEEAAKPFARSADDAERDAELRGRAHWGDPMAGMGKPRGSRWEPEDLTAKYQSAALRKSGFIIPQEVPAHSWMRRGVPPPVNRYSIRPGRHWDGVDRSTGFEKQMFEMQAAKRHKEQQATMWAMEDM